MPGPLMTAPESEPPSNEKSETVPRAVREDWFPTSIWYDDLPDAESINAAILPAIHDERRRDPEGMSDRSTVLGWHSQDDLQNRDVFQPLIEQIGRCVDDVVGFLKWDLDRVRPHLLNCWAIENDHGSSNMVHNHPQSALSGVYYVQAAEGCGDLFFRDPREAVNMFAPPLKERTPWTFDRVTYRPRVGRLLIFPSWLLHGVAPNLSDQTRVCVSFNVGYLWSEGSR